MPDRRAGKCRLKRRNTPPTSRPARWFGGIMPENGRWRQMHRIRSQPRKIVSPLPLPREIRESRDLKSLTSLGSMNLESMLRTEDFADSMDFQSVVFLEFAFGLNAVDRSGGGRFAMLRQSLSTVSRVCSGARSGVGRADRRLSGRKPNLSITHAAGCRRWLGYALNDVTSPVRHRLFCRSGWPPGCAVRSVDAADRTARAGGLFRRA